MHVVHGFIQLPRMMSGNIRCLGVKGCLLRSKSLCPDDYRRVYASGATGPPVVIPSSSKTDSEASRGEIWGGGCHHIWGAYSLTSLMDRCNHTVLVNVRMHGPVTKHDQVIACRTFS